jgi:hypothetical protein
MVIPLALVLWSGRAVAADPVVRAEDGGPAGGPKVGLTVLGGMAVPRCLNQADCGGHLSTGPSIAALALYAPNDSWAVGVAGQMSRVHWSEPYIGMADGKAYVIDSRLTTGFVALAARYVALPDHRVTPIVQAAVGAGLQTQTGTNFHCNDGLIPTGQLSVGARAQASRSFSFFALASATFGLKLSDCSISDGPDPTPFAGWGFGLHAGAAFDVAL